MAAVTIDFQSDWITRLRNRIFTQWRDSESWGRWVELLGRAAQDWENAAQTLLTSYDIENSEGAQLAMIGRIVGQEDPGLGDATYRQFLNARILANRSTGGPEEIYSVFRALYDVESGFYVSPSELGKKEFSLRVSTPITNLQAVHGQDFLGDAKEAGARAILEWQEVATTALFMFNTGSGFNVGVWANAREA